MSGDGDGWVYCAVGHRHWGRFGAAGVLISDRDRTILQHRAPWTHEGGTWGMPGGARDSHEDPTSTALREAVEEADIDGILVEPVAMWIDDHGGWSYTTVLATATGPIEPHAANAESTEVRWWDKAEIDELPLHDGLAAVWPQLRPSRTPLAIVIDTRADETLVALRERTTTGRLDALDRFVRHGVSVLDLPEPLSSPGISAMLARVIIMEPGEGPTANEADERWWRRAITRSSTGADPAADIAAEATAWAVTHQVIVVAADSAVQRHLGESAVRAAVVEPSWLTNLIDA